MELEGSPALWAEDVIQAWKRQEASLKNYGRAILCLVAVSIHIEIWGNLGRLTREIGWGYSPFLSREAHCMALTSM